MTGEAGQGHPLAQTAELAAEVYPGKVFQIGGAGVDGDWTLCSDVDATDVAGWETIAMKRIETNVGASHPTTVSAFVLGWYGHVPGLLAGLFYAIHRRVPRVGRGDLALRRSAQGIVESVALLDTRFLCLADDPAADHPDATVVDPDVLAQRMRAAVRDHADDFLGDYVGGTRLSRRDQVGIFFDGLEIGLWLPGRNELPHEDIIERARHVLPGGSEEFGHPCGLRIIEDGAGQRHLSRQRVTCCYYYRVDGVEACFTCPRTSDEERSARLTALAESSS